MEKKFNQAKLQHEGLTPQKRKRGDGRMKREKPAKRDREMIASNGDFSESFANALSLMKSCARKKLKSAEQSRVCLLKLAQRIAPRLRQKYDASL